MDDVEKKIIRYLQKPKKLSKIMSYLNVDKYVALGLIASINNKGCYNINTKNIDNDDCLLTIIKEKIPEKKEYNHIIGKSKKIKFMVISDSHIGNAVEQLTFLNYLYDYAVKNGITKVYHCGDISDGYYSSRPEQIYSLHCLGFDEQAEYIIKNYPKRDKTTTYFILGNHDETHIRNGGADIGKKIADSRPDMVYLGIGYVRIKLTEECKMDLLHPLDGSSYALSYSGQKYMDALSGGDKPNILLVGHHHKGMYMIYRNIHYFEVPSTCEQSLWERRKRINNTSGAWILSLSVDEEGTICFINSTFINQYKKIENDYKQYV